MRWLAIVLLTTGCSLPKGEPVNPIANRSLIPADPGAVAARLPAIYNGLHVGDAFWYDDRTYGVSRLIVATPWIGSIKNPIARCSGLGSGDRLVGIASVAAGLPSSVNVGGGPEHRVTLSIATHLTPHEQGTQIDTELRFTGALTRSGVSRPDPVHCVSTGSLERAIVEALQADAPE